MLSQLYFFVSIAFGFVAWGIVAKQYDLAETPPALTVRTRCGLF